MPKEFLKKIMIAEDKLMQNETLRFLSRPLTEGNVWHLNRHSAAKAVFIGVFVGFLPLPFHMIMAAVICIVMRANLPLSVALVWINNPLTMAPIFYFEYRLGAFILQIPKLHDLNLTSDWSHFITAISLIWQPLFLGSLICAVTVSAIGYTLVNVLWRQQTLHRWYARQKKRKTHHS